MGDSAKKILFVNSEMFPYLPEGHIANLCRELPQAIQERKNEIRAFMPRYGSQVCCSDNCKSIRQQRLERERADRNLEAARIKAEAKRQVEERRAREVRQRRRER